MRSVVADRQPTVLHFIPQHGIGGAEIAARCATLDQRANVNVHGLFNGIYTGEGAIANERLTGAAARSAFSPTSISSAVARARALDPDLFVFSLWRTFGAFVALRILFPRRKFVTFIHNERTSNPVDKVLSALMMVASDAIWVDSQATFDARLTTPALRRKGRVISLMLTRPTIAPRTEVAPSFIYWGRLARQKRIDRAIDLFSAIATDIAGASLILIGPDHGERAPLQAQAERLGVADRVEFRGAAGRDAIEAEAARASFFLQLSDHEGMAMGVVEALQLGLVPIVTPVGQMAVYCRDGDNALIYRDRDSVVARLRALLAAPKTYAAMSEAAIATFADRPTYTEDVMAAARAIVTS